MKRIAQTFITLLIFAFVFTESQAQQDYYDPEEILIGVRLGAGTSSVNDVEPLLRFDPDTGDSLTVVSPDNRFGYNGGLWLRFPLAPFYFQPELLLSAHKVKYYYDELPATPFLETTKLQIELPLAIGVKIGPLKGQAGVVPTIFLGKGPDEAFETMTMNWQLGAGVDLFRKFTIDGRIEGPLGKYRDFITHADGEDHSWLVYKSKKLVFGLGYIF